ncbi:MAG: hypothetical protein H6R28_28, partial [Methanomicrobiales archaeon]|nr:hypothetical protein [Methanomicrobiales archaeon]
MGIWAARERGTVSSMGPGEMDLQEKGSWGIFSSGEGVGRGQSP